MKIHLEITDLVYGHHSDGDDQPTREIVKHYLARPPARVGFIAWSNFQRQFLSVPPNQVQAALKQTGRSKTGQSGYQALVDSQTINFNHGPSLKKNRPGPGRRGNTAKVVVKFKNEGLLPWLANKTHLEVLVPTSSQLEHPSWQTNRRVATLTKSVPPGHLATFGFQVSLPTDKTYLEEFLQITNSVQAYVPGGRVRLELAKPTGSTSRLTWRLQVGATKLKNRLALYANRVRQQPGLEAKITFTARVIDRWLQGQLRQRRLFQIHKHIFLKIRGGFRRLPRPILGWLQRLVTGWQRILSGYRLLLYNFFRPSRLKPQARLSGGDLVFLLSNPPLRPPVYYRRLKRLAKRRVYLVKFLTDLTPIKCPQFVEPTERRQVISHYQKVLAKVKLVVVLSDSDRRIITKQLRVWQIPKIRVVKVVLTPDLSKPGQAVKHKDYALSVAPLELKSNHQLVAQAYQLAAEQAIDLPPLYLVGPAGWLSENFIRALKHDPVLNSKISYLGVVSPTRLARLYSQARYTIYPAHYASWPLPVSQSLASGCPALVARTSSLPEAGGQLADYFSAHDGQELLEVLIRYQSDQLVAERRRLIKHQYRPINPTDSLTRLEGQIGRLITRGRL